MNRRHLAVLLISGILLAAAIPLTITLSNPSADVDSFPEDIQTLYENRNETESPRPKYVPDEVIIKFKKEVTEGEIVGLRIGQGAEEVYVSSFTFARLWRVPPSKTVEEWADFFDKNPLVEYAEPNHFLYALWYPDDPDYIYQWHFDDYHTNNPGGASSNPYGGVNGGGIRMEEAWQITRGSSNVVVAVIDTGVAYEDYPIPTHEKDTVKPGEKNYQKAPDLAGTSFWQNGDEVAGNEIDDVVNGWDFVNDDAHPNDNNGHGTHVTGTIAQTTDNGLGVAGIAFNTTIMPIKVLDYAGYGTDVDVADGIYYAVDNGAEVINLSLGGDDPSATLENAVAYAYDNGVVVVAASGNDGTESVDYPAAYDDYVVAVGATRYDETRAPYSNYGSSLDLVAPGGDLDVNQNDDEYNDGVLQQTFKPYVNSLNKADPNNWDYYFFDGTSMAAPHVSGVAALLLAQDPGLTPDQIRSVLESTAEDLGAPGRDDTYGWGLVDAHAALQSIAPPLHLVSVAYNSSIMSYPDKNMSPYGPEVSPVYNLTKQALVYLNPENPDNPLSNIVMPGDVVVLKPNLVSPSGFAKEGCTRTAVLRPLVDFAVEAGASKVIIAEGSASPDPEDVVFGPEYSNITGLVEVLQEMYPSVNVTYINLNQDEFTWVDLGENSTFYGDYAADQLYSLYNIRMDEDSYYYAQDSTGYNPEGYQPGLYAIGNTVFEADVFIDVPKMKVHHLTGVTLSMKNLVGITVSSTGNTTNEESIKDIPHWNNSASHYSETLSRQDSFENDVLWRIMADLNKIVFYTDKNGVMNSTRQRRYLSVVDGVIGMEGPTVYSPPAIPRPTGVIVAGENPAAVDAVCSRVMGFNYTVLKSIASMERVSDHPFGMADPTAIAVLGTSLTNDTFGTPYVPHENYEDSRIAPYKIRLQHFDPPEAEAIEASPEKPREGEETKIIVHTQNVDLVAAGWLRYSLDDAESTIIRMLPNEETMIGNLGLLEADTRVSYCVCLQDYFFSTGWSDMQSFDVLPPAHVLIPLSGWSVDPRYTNASYVLNSTETNLYLQLNATDINSRVTIRNLNAPKLNLTIYDHVDVDVTGTGNARILLRFFLDDGSSFDMAYWKDPDTLDTATFVLNSYSERALRGDVYIGLKSSDGLTSNVTITEIAFIDSAQTPIPLSSWSVDPRYTNADYALNSTESSLFLELNATDINSRVTIRNLNAPKLNLTIYDHVDVDVTGTGNARILLRFFMDDGSSFDMAYWKDPTTLNATTFDLAPYSGRTLRGDVYISLRSSDGLTSNITISEMSFVAESPPPPSPLIPLIGWSVDLRYTNALYVLDSAESSLYLQLNATETSSRVTIRHLEVPKLNLSDYDYVDVEVVGSINARVLLRFFLDDGSCFDVVYWKDPTTLNAMAFVLGPYAGRTLRGDVYIGLKSSDGTTSNVTITEISFVDV